MTLPHRHEGRGASAHPSTLTLHRYRYGELDGPPLAALRDHLEACEACRGRLQVQEQERAAFVLRPVPPAIRALAAEAPPRPWWQRLFRELAPFALAAAAALLVIVALPSSRVAQIGPGTGLTQTRGSVPAIEAWIAVDGATRPLHAEDVLGAGDRVQLSYDPRGASFVAIAGRDHTGVVDVFTTDAPTGVGLVQAPFALTLDDAPGVQELFVVTADRPLDPGTVKAAVASDVPGVRVARLAVRKE
ncbi:MAG: zf-HC2 domain-containing protein [Myxococcota bacterium]